MFNFPLPASQDAWTAMLWSAGCTHEMNGQMGNAETIPHMKRMQMGNAETIPHMKWMSRWATQKQYHTWNECRWATQKQYHTFVASAPGTSRWQHLQLLRQWCIINLIQMLFGTCIAAADAQAASLLWAGCRAHALRQGGGPCTGESLAGAADHSCAGVLLQIQEHRQQRNCPGQEGHAALPIFQWRSKALLREWGAGRKVLLSCWDPLQKRLTLTDWTTPTHNCCLRSSAWAAQRLPLQK